MTQRRTKQHQRRNFSFVSSHLNHSLWLGDRLAWSSWCTAADTWHTQTNKKWLKTPAPSICPLSAIVDVAFWVTIWPIGSKCRICPIPFPLFYRKLHIWRDDCSCKRTSENVCCIVLHWWFGVVEISPHEFISFLSKWPFLFVFGVFVRQM